MTSRVRCRGVVALTCRSFADLGCTATLPSSEYVVQMSTILHDIIPAIRKKLHEAHFGAFCDKVCFAIGVADRD